MAFGSLTCQVGIHVASVTSRWLVNARTGSTRELSCTSRHPPKVQYCTRFQSFLPYECGNLKCSSPFSVRSIQHNHEWCAGRHPLQMHGLYSSAQVALETQKMQYINPPSCPTQRGVVKHKCGENTWGSYFVLFDL